MKILYIYTLYIRCITGGIICICTVYIYTIYRESVFYINIYVLLCDIKYNNESAGQRYLDDFYVRRGGSKKLIDKSQDIYQYIKNRT